MRIPAVLVMLLLLVPSGPPPSAAYEAVFTADTMRIDYFHGSGPGAAETIALDRVVNDGPWPGSRTQLVDTTNHGQYLFDERDKATGALQYSRGISSIYGEWATTGEAK
ncbi:MAG: hypothetical protein V7647_3123, partial [Acidobacteriota bacterium]